MKRKAIMVAGLVIVVASVIGYRVLSTRYSLSKLDEIGVVETVNEEASESVKENSSEIAEDSKSSMSGLKDVVGIDYEVPDKAEVDDTEVEVDKIRPGIGWSSGDLSSDELEILQQAAVKVYEQSLCEQGQDVSVELDITTVDDLSHFKYPVYYFVNDDGVLTLQVAIIVKDSDGVETRESRAIKVKYDLDVLVLAD